MSIYSDDLVESGVCWTGNVGSQATAPNMPYIQLFNPIDSGKDIYIDMAFARGQNAHQTGLVWANTAMGSVSTTITPYNMKNGSQGTNVGQMRIGQSATQVLYPIYNIITYETFDFKNYGQPRAFLLEPNHGMAITNYAQSGEYLIGGFYWREVPRG